MEATRCANEPASAQIRCLQHRCVEQVGLLIQSLLEDLLDLFGQYGEVRQCSLPLDRETGRKRGFGFVELASDAEEQKAIDDLQNVEWMGRMIRVNKATPREGGGGGGGGGGGRGGGNRDGGGGGYGGGGNRW